MKVISALATAGMAGVPKSAVLGAWLFVAIMSVGFVVVSIGVYVAQSINIAVSGFAIAGVGAVVGGGVVVRDWAQLSVRHRIFGAGIVLVGLYLLLAIAKWAVATGRVG
jgi:hypothetical protein